MAAAERRRRWPWLVGGTAVFLVAGLWFLGPRLGCAALAPRLPLALGHDYHLTGAATSPPPGAAQATLTLAPERARRFANSRDGLWLPPGWPRAGFTLIGTGRLPRDLVDFDWRVAVARRAPPTLAIRLTTAEANELFSPFRRFPIDRERGLFITWHVSEATARDDDAPGHESGHRRVRIDAIGEMRFEWHGRAWRIDVHHFTGHLDWRFTPVAGGLRPACHLSIDGVDADLPTLPLPGWKDRALWDRLERAANRSFDKHLAKRLLPAGTPIEAAVDGRIGGPVDGERAAVASVAVGPGADALR
jgi:hypothetical protein